MKFFKNIWPGIVIILFVLVVISGILFLDWIEDSEKRLTILITIGIFGLSSIQFIINQINIDRRKLFDLKYEAYKDIVDKLDSISFLFHKEVIDLKPDEFISFYKNLILLRNQTSTTLVMHDQYFFKGVLSKSVSKNILKILSDMEEKSNENSDKIKLKYKDINQNKNDITKLSLQDFLAIPDPTKVFSVSQNISNTELSIEIEMNKWISNFSILETKLYKEKYKFYKLLRKYL